MLPPTFLRLGSSQNSKNNITSCDKQLDYCNKKRDYEIKSKVSAKLKKFWSQLFQLHAEHNTANKQIRVYPDKYRNYQALHNYIRALFSSCAQE